MSTQATAISPVTVMPAETTNATVAKLLAGLQQLAGDYLAWCEDYARACQADPNVRTNLAARASGIASRTWLIHAEKVGLHVWHPVMLQSYDRKLAMLTPAAQEEILTKGVEVARSATTSETFLKKWQDMTADEARLVLARDRIRTLDEQRALLRNPPEYSRPAVNNSYEVIPHHGGYALKVHADAVIPLATLRNIILQNAQFR